VSYELDRSVPLPPQLTADQIRRAVEYVEREAAEWIDVYFEQKNLFSAFVGILGTRALDSVSVYEKNRQTDLAQTRFPDLIRRGSGERSSPDDCLESKASIRPWAVQAHYNHEGWYIVWRYLIDKTMSIETGKPVIIWRVDVVYLTSTDWKYEKSGAGPGGGGRTHTFGVERPATKLKGKAVYKRTDITIKNGKPVPKNSHP
jgi:hypothetical protein